MRDSKEQVHFWNYVLQVAENLEAIPSDDGKLILRQHLNTLKEAFSDEADPVENFEAFVVIKLCAAIEQVLSAEDA